MKCVAFYILPPHNIIFIMFIALEETLMSVSFFERLTLREGVWVTLSWLFNVVTLNFSMSEECKEH